MNLTRITNIVPGQLCEFGHISQVLEPDGIYRCDSMPAGRALWCRFPDMETLYIRPDGSTEPFDFRVAADKYFQDATWQVVGEMPRLGEDDGPIDVAKLAEIFA